MTVAEEIVATNDGTYQSVEGLSEAIDTAQTYLDFADGDPAADTIEMASSVLREAFASLERRVPEDEAIDVDNLAAGNVYRADQHQECGDSGLRIPWQTTRWSRMR